ncbi:MAG: hypothetical protein JWL66_1440 [Sphingomonadales bacterium]|nr:hypothetical protein [Sphingomonadales bacterium]
MIPLIQAHAAEIVAILVVPLTIILQRILRPRAKLVRSIRHAFTHLVDEPITDKDGRILATKQVLHTASLSVTNIGTEPATEVEIVFNWKPQCCNVWPSRVHKIEEMPDGRWAIVLNSITPGETFGMEIFAINKALPALIIVRSSQCEASEMQLQPQQVQPRWKMSVAIYLMIIGLAMTAYWFVRALQFVASG